MNEIIVLLLIQVVLIFLNAIFASAEIAVLSINETKLHSRANSGDRRAFRIQALMKEPARFLATIQVAITLSGFLGSAFAADNFSDPLVGWLISIGVSLPVKTLDTLAVILITLILSYFTLVFGELVPKRIAMKKAESLAFGVSGLISGISVVFRPLVWVLTTSCNGVLRLFGIDPTQTQEQATENEIRMMVDTSKLDKQEQKFIHSIFEFDDLNAKQVCTHRKDVTFLSLDDDDQVWEDTILSNSYTKFPVCKGNKDNIIGVLSVNQYFRLEDKSRESILSKAVFKPYFVHESMKADVLLSNMKKDRQSFAIVLDEYGGVEGIITINDLMSCLIDDLNALYGIDHPWIEDVNTHQWIIHGNVELEDIEEKIGLHFNDEHETFTGFVFDKLGRVVSDTETNIVICHGQFRFEIQSVYRHQIQQAVIYQILDGDNHSLGTKDV